MPRLPQWDTGASGAEATVDAAQQLSPWDTLVLGGVTLPGRAQVHAKRGRKHDRKKPPGTDGETFTDQGAHAAEMDITITVWGADQLNALVDALDKALPAPKKAKPATSAQANSFLSFIGLGGDAFGPPTQADAFLQSVGVSSSAPAEKGETLHPVSISHPSLVRLRVRSILVTEEENIQPGHEKGTFEWRAHAVEYLSPGKTSTLETANGAANDIRLTNEVAAGLTVETPSSTDTAP